MKNKNNNELKKKIKKIKITNSKSRNVKKTSKFTKHKHSS